MSALFQIFVCQQMLKNFIQNSLQYLYSHVNLFFFLRFNFNQTFRHCYLNLWMIGTLITNSVQVFQYLQMRVVRITETAPHQTWTSTSTILPRLFCYCHATIRHQFQLLGHDAKAEKAKRLAFEQRPKDYTCAAPPARSLPRRRSAAAACHIELEMTKIFLKNILF